MVETCVTLAGLALTYGLIRVLLVCIYSQYGLGARVTINNFYV